MNGENSGRILHFDCFGGLAGDMIVAALIDVGVPFEVVEDAVRALPVSGYALRLEKVQRNAVTATRFVVDVAQKEQPHRHYGDIKEMIEGSALSASIKDLASAIFEHIGRAEARVHGKTLDEVHFHEVGAVDSIVDIVGAAAALCHLGAEVTCAPVPLGHGIIHTAHGALPVPAPATLLILEGVPVEGTEIAAELTTPTGAAIVKAAAQRFVRFPEMVPRQVGFGAGTRTHKTRPGLLRVVIGEAHPWCLNGHGTACEVIEANIDDMTGEVASAAAAALHEAGALDVWFAPIQMKKGRPALKISVLCRREDLDRLVTRVFDSTSTIGLRHYPVGRFEMTRRIEEVDTPYGAVRVKICAGPGGSANAAPEFEDCAARAAEHRVPVKKVLAVAAGIAQSRLR